MINSTFRLAGIAVAIATLSHAPRIAQADDQPQPYAPQPYPQPQPQPYPQPYPPPQPYIPPQQYTPPEPTGPEEITDFDENRPVPYGYTKITRTRKGLVIAGAVTFGVTYGISMLAAAIGEDLRRNNETSTNTSSLWIPVAGPFLQMRESESSTGKLYLAHVGLAQTAGAIMLIYGLTNPKTLLVRNDQLSVTPMFGNGSSGLAVAGRF